MNGRRGSPRAMKIAWCGRWNGASSGLQPFLEAQRLRAAVPGPDVAARSASGRSGDGAHQRASHPHMATSSSATSGPPISGWKSGIRSSTRPMCGRRRWPRMRPCSSRPPRASWRRRSFCASPRRSASPYPENDLVNARWYPAPAHKDPKRPKQAIVVLPQWNSDGFSHNALCTLFNRMGVSALRLSMPYHDIRRPAELERSDYSVSANIGRTLCGLPPGGRRHSLLPRLA